MDNEDKIYQLNQLLKYKDVQIEQMKKAIDTLIFINKTNEKIIEDLTRLNELNGGQGNE